MHILFLTQIIPYPPDAGPKVKTWHVLRYLASRGHRVTLASFVRQEEEEHVSALKEVCQEVYTVPISRSRLVDAGYWVRSHFTGRPFLIERDDLQKMRNVVENVLTTQNIDVIHADQLTMTQYGLRKDSHGVFRGMNNTRGLEKHNQVDKPFLIFDAHNAVWTILERMSDHVPWYIRPLATIEARKVKKYEGEIVTEFDHTFAVTEIDRKSLLSASDTVSRGKLSREKVVSIVPIAVDTSKIKPVQLIDTSFSILTLGSLHYPPNADGIRWFFQEVFPIIKEKIPEAQLTIIGKNPPHDFIRFAEKNSEFVNVTGYVPDLEPYLKKAAVVAIPVRAGGGMRVRILEALAYGEAVVTTTIGLEGIDAKSGKEVLVADSPQAFAGAVIRLLEDFGLRKDLAQNGRRLVEKNYDWRVVYKNIDHVYQEIELAKLKESSFHE
jgi:glycosyltransferase involved in cell wall biosynthesis